jgi:peptidoglycan/xylan/chitin deacetylase (PgdA/CDA1 family)
MRASRVLTVPAVATVAAAVLLAAGCSGGAPTQRGAEASAAPTSSSQPPSAVPSSTPSNPATRIDLHADPAAILKRMGVPILTYHQVRNWTADDSKSARAYIMPVAKFTSQMSYLDSHGYHTISPDELLAHLTTGAPLPSKPVMLSFDDGEQGQFETVLPVLKKHHFTATFFPMTVVLGKDGWMSAGELRKLDAAGMTIGGHTWNHAEVDDYSGHDWQKQIVNSTEKLEKIVGHPIHYFAYPDGAWDDAAFSHLKKNGYWAAFQVSFDPIDKKAPRYTLRRTHANPYWSIKEFAAHLKE